MRSRVLRRKLGAAGLLLSIAGGAWLSAAAQDASGPTPDHSPNYGKDPEWFPRFYKPFVRQRIPPAPLSNSAVVSQIVQDGAIRLSLAELLKAVVENNLDVASARYNPSMAQTDLLRAKAGQAPRGVEGARIPSGLFAGAIGAGLGGGGGAGGFGGGGGITGTARRVFVGPRGGFDPSLGFSFSVDHTKSPLNNVRVAGVPIVSTATGAFSASYRQAFITGTSFSLTFNAQRQGSTQQRQLFNPSFTSGFNLSVNQQLLSGFGMAVNRRFQRVAENEQKIAREAFRQQVITAAINAQNAYWDLVASQERVRAADQALQVAQRLYQDNQKQAEIGTLAPVDVTAAQAEVAARRRDLVIAQTNLQKGELQLKSLMSKELEGPLVSARVETVDPLPEPQDADVPAFDQAVAGALRNRTELHQAEGNIQNQQVALESVRNRLKPSFNVFAVLASSGRAGRLGTALNQVTGLDFPESAVGFSLTVPLLNRSAQADDVRARLELRQAETTLQRAQNQIRLEVRNAIIGLLQTKAQVAAAHKAVERNNQTVDAEQKKLRAGVSTPYNVIRTQRDLLSAELAEVQARVSYAKAKVEMDRATGVTLEKANIPLDDAVRGRLTATVSSLAQQSNVAR